MKPGDSLPDPDSVLRYVRSKYYDRAAIMIDGNAFLSRPAEHGGPSFNWLECFEGEPEAQIDAIRRLRRIKYEKHGRLARLNVGRTKAYLLGHSIDFVYDPLPEDAERGFSADPSRAYLAGAPEIDSPEGEAIGDLIVHCVVQVFPTEAE